MRSRRCIETNRQREGMRDRQYIGRGLGKMKIRGTRVEQRGNEKEDKKQPVYQQATKRKIDRERDIEID